MQKIEVTVSDMTYGKLIDLVNEIGEVQFVLQADTDDTFHVIGVDLGDGKP